MTPNPEWSPPPITGTAGASLFPQDRQVPHEDHVPCDHHQQAEHQKSHHPPNPSRLVGHPVCGIDKRRHQSHQQQRQQGKNRRGSPQQKMAGRAKIPTKLTTIRNRQPTSIRSRSCSGPGREGGASGVLFSASADKGSLGSGMAYSGAFPAESKPGTVPSSA